MTKWEQELSRDARTAVINANAQTGRLPQGTPQRVLDELRDAGVVAKVGLNFRGQVAREYLTDWALS